MEGESAVTLPNLRKRRGTVRKMITRLGNRLPELEGATDDSDTAEHAKQQIAKLESLASELKSIHFSLLDLIDAEDERALEKEQDYLDKCDDDVTSFVFRLQRLATAKPASPSSNNRKTVLSRKLARLERKLSATEDTLHGTLGETDTPLIESHREQLVSFGKELSTIYEDLLELDLDDSDELFVQHTRLEKLQFGCTHKARCLLNSGSSEPTTTTDVERNGVKLPKLDVPTFDGDILNWRQFWEQFSISVHGSKRLSDVEKLVYLQQAIKGGSARNAIEGLSRSGDNYSEAISCLKSRYDRPRLIHRTHVQRIVDVSSLKDGGGKELRRLHDTVLQHLRALKTLGHEPSSTFVTSILELKLDQNMMFEWQKHSQESTDVPHYQKLLDFIDLRAQAAEVSISDAGKRSRNDTWQAKRPNTGCKPVASHASIADSIPVCVACKADKHPLHACPKFKSFPHSKMLSTLKSNNLCMNCLKAGHFVRDCQSSHRCRKCQKSHHTLLHLENRNDSTTESADGSAAQDTNPLPAATATPVTTNTTVGIQSNVLLMTSYVVVEAPDGSSVRARALLDSASSASFVSERVSQSLKLPRSGQNMHISGVAGLAHSVPMQSITNFNISSIHSPHPKFSVTAIVVPRVTRDLPLRPIALDTSWSHLVDISLADPDFGTPSKVDLLLGVDVFAEIMMQGRRAGSPGSPTAFETKFGWVLAGSVEPSSSVNHVVAHHVSLLTGDDILCKFWEIEEQPMSRPTLSPEERIVVQHFEAEHTRNSSGRFVVPLPRKPDSTPLGESRAQAVRRFLSLERALHAKGQFDELKTVMKEYFDSEHAEVVPEVDLDKPPPSVFYLPMHIVRKESSSTTKIRAVFDASAKSSTGVSLNDTLLVGPTVHPPLVDVLLRFRLHRVALTTDVSRMYRGIELPPSDRDLHRFVWRSDKSEPIQDFRMTRVTFGVSASSFAANMAVRQNAVDLAMKYPLAYKAVMDSFYVDDGLIGADTAEEAVQLHKELQDLFGRAKLLLRKWNSNNPIVLQDIPPELRDSQPVHQMPDSDGYTKTLGVEWNTKLDHFRLAITQLPSSDSVTKRTIVSDIAKTYDVLGWFSPTIVKVKILLQRLWEQKVDWDDPVPDAVHEVWSQWRNELDSLTNHRIPRCYYPTENKLHSMQLHGFSDASELAYAGAVYMRVEDSSGNVHVALVTSKTKVAPIKRLTIPRLELCGAHLLAQLLRHVQEVFRVPLHDVHAWTDSTIVLNWLVGNPRRFKPYVANRVSHLVELVPPDRWRHVLGPENPADCASRGLFPSELLQHPLWWHGPNWLSLDARNWPQQIGDTPQESVPEEERELCLHTITHDAQPLIPVDSYSSFTRLKRITAWVLRFVWNCRNRKSPENCISGPLTVPELDESEKYWVLYCQRSCFASDLATLESKQGITPSSSLFSLHPFIDSAGIIRVGGRMQNARLPYHTQHQVILSGKHSLTKLLIQSEHLRLLHAGPTLLGASLGRKFHIIRSRKIIRSITRSYVICRRHCARSHPPSFGQLPIERVTPDSVFARVGLDYAGPLQIKLGHVRKPTVLKAYVCIFVSLTVKATHLELVSDLTTEAFLGALRRFISRRGKPSLLWSDHGSNFVGAASALKELDNFLQQQVTQGIISNFCSTRNIVWKFIPEHAPHFGGLWEAAVKSTKYHLKRIVGPVKLTFEELTTVLSQIEACLNSRPLTPLATEDDGIEALTPGHFLIGRPLESLPDPSFSHQSLNLLRRWNLCQALVRHFWQRWSREYVVHLQKFGKWHSSQKNLAVGDMVILKEDNMVPSKWPIARVLKTHPGKDDIVHVVTVRTPTGTYTRPVVKIAPLLTNEP